MKNKALPTLLLIATIGVVSTHLEWSKTDNGHLLYVDGRAIGVFQGSCPMNFLRPNFSSILLIQFNPVNVSPISCLT